MGGKYNNSARAKTTCMIPACYPPPRPVMMQSIPAKLATLAQQENLHFLLAVESGSRAWGFASPDSDYDVRALYIRPPAHYLCIDEGKDTFEFI